MEAFPQLSRPVEDACREPRSALGRFEKSKGGASRDDARQLAPPHEIGVGIGPILGRRASSPAHGVHEIEGEISPDQIGALHLLPPARSFLTSMVVDEEFFHDYCNRCAG